MEQISTVALTTPPFSFIQYLFYNLTTMISSSFPFSSYYHLIFRICGQTAVETPNKNRVLGTTPEYGRCSMEMGSADPRSGRRSGLE